MYLQLTIWIGVFPLVITRWLTLGLTIYSVATQCVLYYVRHPNHTEALWFASVANSLLWWTYVKVTNHTDHNDNDDTFSISMNSASVVANACTVALTVSCNKVSCSTCCFSQALCVALLF